MSDLLVQSRRTRSQWEQASFPFPTDESDARSLEKLHDEIECRGPIALLEFNCSSSIPLSSETFALFVGAVASMRWGVWDEEHTQVLLESIIVLRKTLVTLPRETPIVLAETVVNAVSSLGDHGEYVSTFCAEFISLLCSLPPLGNEDVVDLCESFDVFRAVAQWLFILDRFETSGWWEGLKFRLFNDWVLPVTSGFISSCPLSDSNEWERMISCVEAIFEALTGTEPSTCQNIQTARSLFAKLYERCKVIEDISKTFFIPRVGKHFVCDVQNRLVKFAQCILRRVTVSDEEEPHCSPRVMRCLKRRVMQHPMINAIVIVS